MPDHADGWTHSEEPHDNSLIVSHAYYRLARDVGLNTAEQIAWTAVTEKLPPDAGFERFRTACLDAASDRYGRDGREVRAVEKAFDAVGLDGTWRKPPR